MSALKLVLGIPCRLGSVALAFVVGFVNPQRKVNGLCWSWRQLYLYARVSLLRPLDFAALVELNNQRVTPAMRLNDGVNFSSHQ